MWLPTIRDIAIILLAVESLVIGGLLVVLVWQIWRLVRTLETEIRPLLNSANETVNTVRGTSQFVSENVVDPVVRIHSFIAGIRGGIKSFVKRKSPPSAATKRAQSLAREIAGTTDESEGPIDQPFE